MPSNGPSRDADTGESNGDGYSGGCITTVRIRGEPIIGDSGVPIDEFYRQLPSDTVLTPNSIMETLNVGWLTSIKILSELERQEVIRQSEAETEIVWYWID
jgi:hypothetical protein